MESASLKPSKFLDNTTLFLNALPPFKKASSAFTKYFFLFNAPILSMAASSFFICPKAVLMKAISFGSSKYKPFFSRPSMLTPERPAFRFIIVPSCTLLFTSLKSRCNTENNFQKSRPIITPISSRQMRSSFLLLNHSTRLAIGFLLF